MTTLTPYSPPPEKFPGEGKLRIRMAKDFPFYAERNLQIQLKEGGLGPLKLNRAQQHIHDRLEEQKKETGKVRAIVLKARQQGCSTYTAGRFHHAVTHSKGKNAFILSHAMDTTKKLFGITRRYYDNSDPLFKPTVRAASANELSYDQLDSSYYVGTAGAKGTGRGGTLQFFHWSEVAFSANPDMHFAGIMQSIADGKKAKGTEVILESTANGPVGKFYDLCQNAMKGKGEYILIFTPWYWQEEYAETPPVGWTIEGHDDTEANQEAQKKYNLDMEQVYWMHLKRIQLGSDHLFKQEYPAFIQEAFQESGDESFITGAVVDAAMVPKDDMPDSVVHPLIGMLDPAGASAESDRTGIGHRCGRRMYNLEYTHGMDVVDLAAFSKVYIMKWGLDYFFVDSNGLGAGVYDILKRDKEIAEGCVVKASNWASKPLTTNPDGSRKYANRKAECYDKMLTWLKDTPCEIPRMAALRADLTVFGYDRSNGYLLIESKKSLKLRGVKSTDGTDVLAGTFTEDVGRFKLRDSRKSAMVVPEYDILGFGLGV